jgi:hypothetical protein
MSLASNRPSTVGLPDTLREITVESNPERALGRIVEAALREVPGSEYGGISELTKRGIRTRAASHASVEMIDRAQYRAGEGPCLTAAVAQAPVVVSNDVRRDLRWPRFGRAVAALDVASVISFKLYDATGTVGALNLYASECFAFSADAEEIGSLLAAHAGVVMNASRKQANLGVALVSRDVVGQAKGILMERYKIDDRAAFETLIAISQHAHRKLREIADELRTTGAGGPGMTIGPGGVPSPRSTPAASCDRPR